MHTVNGQRSPALKSVKFRLSGYHDHRGIARVPEITTHTFSLGMGPCGRFVTDLRAYHRDGLFIIEQTSQSPSAPSPTELEAAITACLKFTAENRERGRLGVNGAWSYGPHFKTPEAAAEYARLKDHYEDLGRRRTEDVEVKVFTYRFSDVVGRIEEVRT